MGGRLRGVIWGGLALALLAGTAPAETPSTADILGNLRYEAVLEGPIALRDGHWEGEPEVAGAATVPMAMLIPHSVREGELDGADGLDAIALVMASTGGSGTFIHLVGVADVTDEAAAAPALLLGDRVQVHSMTIDDQLVRLTWLEAGPEDGLCCPTQLRASAYRLGSGGFEEVTSAVRQASFDDLGGQVWRLASLGDEAVDDAIEVTAEFVDGRIAGRSACNRYTGGFELADDLSVSMGMAAVTRMACPDPLMAMEQRYLAALAEVTTIAFDAGDLLLLGDHEDLPLRFRPTEP